MDVYFLATGAMRRLTQFGKPPASPTRAAAQLIHAGPDPSTSLTAYDQFCSNEAGLTEVASFLSDADLMRRRDAVKVLSRPVEHSSRGGWKWCSSPVADAHDSFHLLTSTLQSDPELNSNWIGLFAPLYVACGGRAEERPQDRGRKQGDGSSRIVHRICRDITKAEGSRA
jgi:hypothetical protein